MIGPGGLAPRPYWPPNCLKNCWICGGRLLDASFTILTLTETTAGLTRAISDANDGIGCACKSDVTTGAAVAGCGAVKAPSPSAPAAISDRAATEARMRLRLRRGLVRLSWVMVLSRFVESPPWPPLSGRCRPENAPARLSGL